MLECNAPKELSVMAISSHDIKSLVYNQYFRMDLNLVCGDAG